MFCCRLLTSFKSNIFSKEKFGYRLDSDQNRYYGGPDLGPS